MTDRDRSPERPRCRRRDHRPAGPWRYGYLHGSITTKNNAYQSIGQLMKNRIRRPLWYNTFPVRCYSSSNGAKAAAERDRRNQNKLHGLGDNIWRPLTPNHAEVYIDGDCTDTLIVDRDWWMRHMEKYKVSTVGGKRHFAKLNHKHIDRQINQTPEHCDTLHIDHDLLHDCSSNLKSVAKRRKAHRRKDIPVVISITDSDESITSPSSGSNESESSQAPGSLEVQDPLPPIPSQDARLASYDEDQIPKPTLRAILAAFHHRKVEDLRPFSTCLLDATIIALHYLGSSSRGEIAEFVVNYRLWDERCYPGLIGAVIWKNLTKPNGERLFVCPTQDQFDFFPNKSGPWNYSLSEVGEQHYRKLTEGFDNIISLAGYTFT